LTWTQVDGARLFDANVELRPIFVHLWPKNGIFGAKNGHFWLKMAEKWPEMKHF
jgi:hypothetical protein